METKEKIRARRNSERLSNSPATSDLYEPDDFSEGLTTYQTESGGLNSSNLYDPFDSEAESADDETYVNFASPNTSECFEPESDIHENDSPIISTSGNSNSSKQSDPINSSEAAISPFKTRKRRTEQDIPRRLQAPVARMPLGVGIVITMVHAENGVSGVGLGITVTRPAAGGSIGTAGRR